MAVHSGQSQHCNYGLLCVLDARHAGELYYIAIRQCRHVLCSIVVCKIVHDTQAWLLISLCSLIMYDTWVQIAMTH